MPARKSIAATGEPEPVKGKEIKVLDGKYAGKTGWVNTAKGEGGFTEQQVYLLLNMGKNKERCTRLFQHQVVFVAKSPRNLQEAIFYQHSHIQKLLHQLTKELAMVDCPDDDIHHHTLLTEIFMETLNAAAQRQAALGSKAKWIKVKWAPAKK